MKRTHSRAHAGAGFSLVELLVAMSVLVILSLVLLGISNQVGKTWVFGESKNQNRMKARAAIEFIGREMQAAFLSPDPADLSLQFVINPSTVTLRNHDAVFWQAPIATDQSQGDLAIVGYFVRWKDGTASLCRFFANPSNTTHHFIDQHPETTDWISDSLLDSAAPADKANHYAGLFLENVAGLWVEAYKKDGTSYGGDSRLEGNSLPAWVDIGLVLLDGRVAEQLRGMSERGDIITASGTAASAEDFLNALPSSIQSGASIVSFRVALNNQR